MRHRRRRAFGAGTRGNSPRAAGRVRAGKPGAAAGVLATAPGVPATAPGVGLSFTSPGIGFSFTSPGVGFSVAAGVSRASATPSPTAATGLFAGIAAGAAAWLHRAAASGQVLQRQVI